ncbi:hypothetical protein PANT_22d00035 [Moesziomyces antarcticus T-34]|uniref:Uncharacterized protein n=1 Tax=Pseudozyma antarctica (strain T-34) TaxID=1151754 RepID=M9LZI1_PSEA3|nr:hypothetical protein PANT_22d00035 [Moesziomyces antarcticus T-34]
MASFLSRRTSHILLVLLGLFLAGTIVVLTTANAYFSIDSSAYILPEELGTWQQIQSGDSPDGPDSWAARIPWLAKLTQSSSAASSPPTNTHNNTIDPNDPIARPQPWRDNTPKPWDAANPAEKIPRIIHQTWKDQHLPPRWQAIRDECEKMHPDYEYMLWTDASSRSFIEQHYNWFLPVFDAYPYPIQRADAIRYFVLHHYGGIYMDLDIGCLRRFDPLLRFEVILPKTIPVGVSNDVMLAAKAHPFMDQLIHNLVNFNHQYLTNYPTVMFSTGPMFVSASYGLYVDVHGPAFPSTPKQPDAGFKGVRVLPKSLYGKNVKPIDAPDAFFSHFYGSSWHANDAGFLIFLRKYGRVLIVLGLGVVLYGFFRTLLPSPSKKKGVLYLPAYFVRGDDGASSTESQQLSPSSSASSQQLAAAHTHSPLSQGSFGPSTAATAASAQSLGQWAHNLLPAGWRGPSPAPSHTSRRSRLSQDVDLESLGSRGSQDADEDWKGRADAQPLLDREGARSAPPPYESPYAENKADENV